MSKLCVLRWEYTRALLVRTTTSSALLMRVDRRIEPPHERSKPLSSATRACSGPLAPPCFFTRTGSTPNMPSIIPTMGCGVGVGSELRFWIRVTVEVGVGMGVKIEVGVCIIVGVKDRNRAGTKVRTRVGVRGA